MRRCRSRAATLGEEPSEPLRSRTTRRRPPFSPIPTASAPRMTLFLSDLHLGREPDAATREAERDAVALLAAHEREVMEGGRLVLVGDVFHEWVEYKHLAPKRGLRLLGLLANWCDAGAEVHYLVGNRDPWHVDLMEQEVGVVLHRGAWRTGIAGWSAYIAHGDGFEPPDRAISRFTNRLQPLVRHPHTARLYRTLLPGDTGFALARWVSRTFGTSGEPDPYAHRRVTEAAHDLLRTDDTDLVVMGHSHQHALDETPDGVYLNPGYWFGARTFARIGSVTDAPAPGEAVRPQLLRWTGQAALPLTPRALATA